AVVGRAAHGVGAQAGGELGLRGAGAGAVALPQRGAVQHGGVVVVLDERAHARDVVLRDRAVLHGDLVADVEDREVDRGRIGVLAGAEADVAVTAAGGEQRGQAHGQGDQAASGRDAGRVFARSIHWIL